MIPVLTRAGGQTAPMTETVRRRQWFEPRYAVAGLGWGVLVGMVTGALLAILVLVESRGEDPDVGLTVFGMLYGAAVYALLGAISGLLCAVVLPAVSGRRAHWWAALVLTAGIWALATVLLFTYLVQAGGVEVAGTSWMLVPLALATLPGLAAGVLVARSTRNLR